MECKNNVKTIIILRNVKNQTLSGNQDCKMHACVVSGKNRNLMFLMKTDALLK